MRFITFSGVKKNAKEIEQIQIYVLKECKVIYIW